MTTPIRTARRTLVAICAPLIAVAMVIGVPEAQSASYKTCGLSERDQDPPGSKPTYNLSLRQRSTTCATAKKVMNGFQRCRAQTSYTCSRTVAAHWRCSGRRDSHTDTISYAIFTCTWGTRRVVSSYQQNT